MRCYTQTLDTRFLDGVVIPPFVKTAGLLSSEESATLPDGCFALVVLEKDAAQRMMPLKTPDQVWVAGEYLHKVWPGMPKIAAAMAAKNIISAANFFEVEIPESLAKVAALDPTATGRLYQRTEWDLPVGYSELLGSTKTASYTMGGDIYPIGNLSELQAAEAWFDRNSEKLAYAHRYRMANFIAGQRVNLIPPGEKQASMPFSDKLEAIISRTEFNPQLDTELYKRASMCRRKDHAERYIGWALNKTALTIAGPAAAIDMVHSADVDSGLHQGYGTWVNNPIDTVMTQPWQSRVENDEHEEKGYPDRPLHIEGVTGQPLSLREVARSCEDGSISKVMSQSFADGLRQRPELTLAALPPELRSVIINQIRPGASR